MKINGNLPIEEKKILNRAQDLNKNQDVEKKEEAQKTESSRDKVSLSGKAREISELKGMIEEIPDIRRDKVDALKKAVDTGTYSFDAIKVAQKMIEEDF